MTDTTRAGAARPETSHPAVEANIGLGSNMGDKAANIARALALIEEGGGVRVVARSALWRSAPWGVTDQDWFVNAAAAITTTLAPRALLARCQEVEARMGRVRERHWGPRVIDLDILTYGDVTIAEPDLVVPHPLIAARAFVLAPLAEIRPALVIGGARVDDLLAAADRTGLEPVAGSAPDERAGEGPT